mmetsp:Transcript_34769/g.87436  ORF Transcript_34769/g.87436 Transcript_34769/m.87436 type:complete len:282 (+) Transcript_34769:56-901(+)
MYQSQGDRETDRNRRQAGTTPVRGDEDNHVYLSTRQGAFRRHARARVSLRLATSLAGAQRHFSSDQIHRVAIAQHEGDVLLIVGGLADKEGIERTLAFVAFAWRRSLFEAHQQGVTLGDQLGKVSSLQLFGDHRNQFTINVSYVLDILLTPKDNHLFGKHNGLRVRIGLFEKVECMHDQTSCLCEERCVQAAPRYRAHFDSHPVFGHTGEHGRIDVLGPQADAHRVVLLLEVGGQPDREQVRGTHHQYDACVGSGVVHVEHHIERIRRGVTSFWAENLVNL